MRDIVIKSPETDDEWNAYHRIREKVLWEARGQFGVYVAGGPDEHSDGNHPKILILDGEPVGVVRIDLNRESREAKFRKVAIVERLQGKGLGTELMALAEQFSVGKGYLQFAANVSQDAIGFYEKIGYRLDPEHPTNKPSHPRMTKINHDL